MESEWRGRSVLITGATGFLGLNLALRLSDLGATVYGTSRNAGASKWSIRWVQTDLTDIAAVSATIGAVHPDVIFHLAGQTSASPDRNLIIPTLRGNLVSTVLVLLGALELGVSRVVVTGSLEEPICGAQGPEVLSPYGVSKRASVEYARLFDSTFGLPVSIVRIFMTYGPHQSPAKLIPYLMLRLLAGEAPTVAQPDRTIDWVYVDDIVEGLLAAGLRPEALGRTIELGSGRLVAIRDLVREIEELANRPSATNFSEGAARVGIAGRRANTEDAIRYLAWSARTSLREGLIKTLAWNRDELARNFRLSATHAAG